jgi:dTDP-4-amino-4,6-dideoxy-D-galactose acyltransferase
MSSPSPVPAPGSLLEWDTNFFGFRVGRARAATLTEASLAGLLQWAEVQQVRCLYFAADGQSPETLALAARGGFQFIDVRLDLGYPLGPARPAPEPGFIRPAQANDLPALQAIARVSHHDSRFFKDRGFPAGRGADLYAEWIRRDLAVHTTFVAHPPEAEAPVGYISCQVEPGSKEGRIGLLAVAARHSGRGTGGALVQAALAWFSAQGCPVVKVATQASNLPAQRLYQAAGFRTVESTAWFHRWFPPVPSLP